MRAGDGASCTGSVTGSPSTRCHAPWVDRPAGLPGAALISVSALLSDRLLVQAAVAGLVLVAVGVVVLSVRLPRGW